MEGYSFPLSTLKQSDSIVYQARESVRKILDANIKGPRRLCLCLSVCLSVMVLVSVAIAM